MSAQVIPISLYSVVNVNEYPPRIHFTGSREQCFDHILQNYTFVAVSAIYHMGWRAIPARENIKLVA